MLKSICLHITNSCNLQCIHCWSNSGPLGDKRIIWEDIDKFVSLLLPIGLNRVSLSGGEPFLHPQINLIVSKLLEKDLKVIITTNGTLPARISNLLSTLTKEQRELLEIRTSIDGPEHISNYARGDNSYQKSLSSVRLIKKLLGKVSINTVVGLQLDHDEYSWLSFFNELASADVDEISLITLSPRGRQKYSNLNQKILDLTKMVENTAFKSKFKSRLLVWDYLSVEYGYVLIEHNGEVLLPGIRDEDDIRIGMINSVTVEEISKILITSRNKLNYSYRDDT